MKKGKKRGEANVPLIIISVFGGITLILIIAFVYMSLYGPNYTETYNQKIQSGEIQNPITEFQLSNDVQKNKILIENNLLGTLNTSEIKKGLIKYASVILQLYNLHNIPFTQITPKIQVYIGQDAYNVEVTEGTIIIKEGEIQDADIIIRTTNEEALKISENGNYAKGSVSSGKTTIEFVASKIILFAKGYSTLYQELNKQ